MLFLLPSEIGFLLYLKKANIPLNQLEFPNSKLVNLQPQLELLIGKNFHLQQLATQAFKAYLNAYNSSQLKIVFDLNKLDLKEVAKSFGFEQPPFVNLGIISVYGFSGSV